MDEARKEILNQVFEEVAETMAFVFPEPITSEDIETFPSDNLLATMKYMGEKNGSFSLLVTTEMCLEIAANTLGKTHEETMKQVIASDAVRELLNITCGKALTEIFGEEPIFDLTPPEVSFQDESIWNDLLKNENALLFMVDDWPAVLLLKEDD